MVFNTTKYISIEEVLDYKDHVEVIVIFNVVLNILRDYNPSKIRSYVKRFTSI